jgi:group I intron endonuclease
MADAILAQSGIYAITNTINGKRYIGQSTNIRDRAKRHFAMLMLGTHHCHHLQRAFKVDGAEAFQHDILELCGHVELTVREQHWMDHYRITGIYNSAPAAGSNFGVKHSDETRAKFSAAKTGLKLSEEAKANMRSAFSESRRVNSVLQGLRSADRLRSAEHKALISAALRGRARPGDVRAKISAANKGKPKSEAHRRSMGLANLGTVRSEVTKERMRKSQALAKDLKREKALAQWARPGAREEASAARKGRKTSEETKAILGAQSALRWADPEFRKKMKLAHQVGKHQRAVDGQDHKL